VFAVESKNSTMHVPMNRYQRTIMNKNGSLVVDVYDVLAAWEVTNPALAHLIKKALQPGQRGHKDTLQDYTDIIDSAHRAKDVYEARACILDTPEVT